MSRTMMIMVSDNPETIAQAKKYWENSDVTVQVFSPTQFRDGIENSGFRTQLCSGVPALFSGLTPVQGEGGGNVVPFPVGGQSHESKVYKMEELEAKAIEDAIHQYRGNLTEAAKALGIGRATLYRKVKQYQIDPSSARRKKQVAA